MSLLRKNTRLSTFCRNKRLRLCESTFPANENNSEWTNTCSWHAPKLSCKVGHGWIMRRHVSFPPLPWGPNHNPIHLLTCISEYTISKAVVCFLSLKKEKKLKLYFFSWSRISISILYKLKHVQLINTLDTSAQTILSLILLKL